MGWLTTLVFLLVSCGSDLPDIGVAMADAGPEAERVLLVLNRRSADSLDIGRHYAERRGIPREHVVFLDVPAVETIESARYRAAIEDPVRQALERLDTVDFVVLTKGVPIRLDREGGYSVDGHLASMYLDLEPIREPEPDQIRRSRNPYFSPQERFRRHRFNMVLVTRLDGWTAADAKALVDRAMDAKPHRGPFLIDLAGDRGDGGYGRLQERMRLADETLRERGYWTILHEDPAFADPEEPLAGYVSWGSNDARFDEAAYLRIGFLPGAIAETFVSTSGRTFTRPAWGSQSLIADLVSAPNSGRGTGVTGVKGYVSEPYTFALCDPAILFDRYTRGFNLAESFYAASPVVKWKDVVLGDPLCNPYALAD